MYFVVIHFKLQEDLTLDVLGLAHCYGFGDLETAISDFLKAEMIVGNLCNVYGQAHAYALNSLIDYCLEFADKHASEILQSSGFSQLAPVRFYKVIFGTILKLLILSVSR